MIMTERYGHPARRAPGGNMPVTLLVQLWSAPGSEHLLIDYEDQVLRRLAAHGARVVQRVRTKDAPNGPFEAQILEFPSDAALDAYMTDPERARLSDLRDRAIARTDVLRVDVVGP
jgi:uncharacterized protein (DUF1330 family)